MIAAATGSLPEIVNDGVTGFLVPTKSPAAIREKLERLRADPSLATEIGERGRKEVLRRFTWEAVARRCLEAYAT